MRVTHQFAPQVVRDPVEALRRAIYDRHALEAAAMAIGVSHQTLSKKLNPDEEAQLSLRQAAAIEAFLDTDALAECHAARRHGVFVKLPAAQQGPDAGRLTGDFARLVREFGETSEAFSSMVGDGQVTAAEVDRLEKELQDVIKAGLRLVRDARAMQTEATVRRLERKA